jgi:hypothetical protein
MTDTAISRWHRALADRDPSLLDGLLADDVVFHSPVVHTPQVGKAITTKYLTAAMHVFGNETFRYVREVAGPDNAVLEFMVEIDGIVVNGVDMLRWNDDQRLTEFKVMVRPLKGMQVIHSKMADRLTAMPPAAGPPTTLP